MKHNLFSRSGEVIAKIDLPAPLPDIIIWQGLYFHLVAGRYVEATVWQHIG